MKSLLRRAGELRKAAGSELGSLGLADGISREDRDEILLHIDEVAKKARILPGPDSWRVRPRRRGFGLPLVVNLAGLAVLGLGLFALGRAFSPEAASSVMAEASLSSAEGQLLREIKREAEGRLQEKDREIASIQSRMAELDAERTRIASGVEERIRAKEAELKTLMAEELERERARLVEQGLSAEAIQERLRDFERRKAEEFRSQLDEFSRKAEAERATLQASLDKAKAEFSASLGSITAERQRIQDEARQRELELRTQLDERGAALEAERARVAATLKDAQAELTRLSEEARRDKAEEDRLLGLYAAARQALRDGRVDDASAALATLRSTLADPRVAAIPALARRRELDLLAAELLDKAVAAERAKTSVEAGRLSSALEAVASARAEAERGRAAVLAGRPADAEAAYRGALRSTAELSEALEYLEAGWRSRLALESAALAEARSEAQGLVAAAKAREARVAELEGELSQVRSALASAEARLVESRGAAEALRAERAAAWLERDASLAGRREAVAESAALRAERDEVVKDRDAATRDRDAAIKDRDAAFKDRDAALAEREARPVADAASATAVPAELAAEIAALKDRASALELELSRAQGRYEAITTSYRAFAAGDDLARPGSGASALVEARRRLDAFLSSPEIDAALPGFRDRVARYLDAFQAVGAGEVLYNAADIVDGAARIRDSVARERYLSELEARYPGDPAMAEFLASVRAALPR